MDTKIKNYHKSHNTRIGNLRAPSLGVSPLEEDVMFFHYLEVSNIVAKFAAEAHRWT